MVHKETWMHYFLIGISAIILTTGCGKEEIEYRMKVDLVFKNQTDSLVEFEILEDISSNFVTTVELRSFTDSKTFSYEYVGVGEMVEPENCCDSFLGNVYISKDGNGLSKKIILNDTLCVVHDNNKSTLIENYNSKIIAYRHFEYTYIFYSDDFIEAKLCE